MKIVQFGTHALKGGAAKAVYGLHSEFRCLGHDSKLFVKDPDGIYRDDVICHSDPGGRKDRFVRRLPAALKSVIRKEYLEQLGASPSAYEMVSTEQTGVRNVTPDLFPDAQVFQFNWVTNFFEWDAFLRPSRSHSDVPVFWRLPDLQAITGGCHYTGGCRKYLEDCGNCPQIPKHSDLGEIAMNALVRRRKLFNSIPEGKLHLIAQSRWIERILRESPISNRFAITRIPNGVDRSIYFPVDQRAARQVIGIPEHAKVVLFAGGAESGRRGSDLLVSAFRLLLDEQNSPIQNMFLLTIGSPLPLGDLESRIKGLHLGIISNALLFRLAYSSADVTAIPSREDNFPNVALESLACGTPVVAFDTGGLPDIIDRPALGRLAKNINPHDLAGCLQSFFEGRCPSPLKEAIERVEKDYSLRRMANDYLNLYSKSVASAH